MGEGVSRCLGPSKLSKLDHKSVIYIYPPPLRWRLTGNISTPTSHVSNYRIAQMWAVLRNASAYCTGNITLLTSETRSTFKQISDEKHKPSVKNIRYND